MSYGLVVIAAALAADPAPADAVRGRVTWAGDVPAPTPLLAFRPGPDGQVTASQRPAPNVPRVDPASCGVANVAVFLRGDGLPAAKAWPHPPVSVELHDGRPMVRSGDGPPATVGLVRRGDAVTFASRQNLFHALRARGAAFWTLTFPDADKPIVRRFDEPGLVELSSGAGHYWMHGYLWVCDNPFVALTDADGRFAIAGVPAGHYELTAWLPNWRVARQERDPESTAVVRVAFERPLERKAAATTGREVAVMLP